MKLCPQCAFIYEDNQRFCDMDGKELVHEPAPVVTEQSVKSPPTRLAISLPAKSQSRHFPFLLLGGVVLASLLSVVYVTQLHQSRRSNAERSSIQSPEHSTERDTSPETSSVVDTHLPAPAAEQLPEEPPGESLSSPTNVAALSSASSVSQLSQSPSSAASVTRRRLASNPVSAGGLSGKSRGPVIVRLTNGATIKADEAWERSEGIWYRQAGMVTFLKHGRIRTIERPASPHPQLKSANKAEESSRKSESTSAQNQLRIRRLEAPETKKPSRVRSFLKKTGQLLKKPFKF